MARRAMVGMVVVGAALTALTGCTMPAATLPAAAAAAASPADGAPTVTASPADLEWHQVVASGDFATADGTTLGRIEIVVGEHGRFDARVSGWNADLPAQTGLTLHPDPVPFDSCPDTGFALGLGDLAGQPTQYFTIGTMGSGDPSFLESAVLSTFPAGGSDCMRPVTAVAALTWSIPDRRPGLRVVDSGAATAAAGDATLVDGAPTSYLVHGDDTFGAIAERFGITTSDLQYLNPTRTTPGPSDQAYAGETLNLSRALR